MVGVPLRCPSPPYTLGPFGNPDTGPQSLLPDGTLSGTVKEVSRLPSRRSSLCLRGFQSGTGHESGVPTSVEVH